MSVRGPSARVIDPKKGVVFPDGEMDTNAYIENQSQIDVVVYDMVMNGDLIVIEKDTAS